MGRHNSLSGVTLEKRLTWSPHIYQVSRRTAQRVGLLGPLLNRKSDISIRNGVLYKQLICPMMDYACPAWRSAVRCSPEVQTDGYGCQRTSRGRR